MPTSPTCRPRIAEEAAHYAAWLAEEAEHRKWVHKRKRLERKPSSQLLEGTYIHTASGNKTIRWYNAKDGEVVSTVKTSDRPASAIGSDGLQIGSLPIHRRGIVQECRAAVDIWNIKRNILELNQICFTAFSWGGNRLAGRIESDITARQLQIWNTGPVFTVERLLLSFVPRIRVERQLFLMQRHRVVAAGEGLAVIFDADTGVEILVIDYNRFARNDSVDLVLANDVQADMTTTFAVVTGGKVICYDVASGQLRGEPLSLGFGRDLAACFASDGTFIHYNMPRNILSMWNVETAENIFQVKIETDIFITRASFNSITNCIFLIDECKKVHLHDGTTGQHICTTKKYEQDILAVHFDVPKVILL
jgi:WD40 repeat protein